MSPDDDSRAPNRRTLLKTLGVGAAAAGLAGCSGNSNNTTTTSGTTAGGTTSETTTTSGKATVGGDYVVGDSTPAKSLNWLGISDTESDNRIGLTLDGMYTITSDQEIFPLWGDIDTNDNKKYTVTLKDNLKWSDPYGQVTADDFVYMIEKVFQAPDNWSGYSNASDWFYTDANGKKQPYKVQKEGKLSFSITLDAVDPSFPKKPIVWGLYGFPKGLLKKYVPDKDAKGLQQDEEVQNLGYTGNLGPYTFEKWDRQSQFVASRNDDYYLQEVKDLPDIWHNAPYFDSYTYKVIPEQSSRLGALKSGQITTTGIPSSKYQEFKDASDVYVNKVKQSYCSILVYNQRMNGWKPFRNKDVRMALSYAVSKDALVNQVDRGLGEIAQTFQPKFSQWYDDSKVVKTGVGDKFGAGKAKSHLSDALSGTEYSYNGDTLVDGNGQQVTLSMVYSTGSSTTKTMAQLIQQEYAKIGIDVKLTGVQFSTMLNKYVANSYQGSGKAPWTGGPYNAGPRDKTKSKEDWDLMLGIRFNTYPLTPTSTTAFWLKKASTNYYGYEPEADLQSLYDTASQSTDKAKRKQALSKIFGALSEEQPVNFFEMGIDTIGYRDKVEGPKAEFFSGWDYQTYRFKQQ